MLQEGDVGRQQPLGVLGRSADEGERGVASRHLADGRDDPGGLLAVSGGQRDPDQPRRAGRIGQQHGPVLWPPGRDQAHEPAAQPARRRVAGAPAGRRVQEQDAGHVEHEPRAALADDPQQGLLQRGLRADVDRSADRHDGAVVTGADTAGHTHDPL